MGILDPQLLFEGSTFEELGRLSKVISSLEWENSAVIQLPEFLDCSWRPFELDELLSSGKIQDTEAILHRNGHHPWVTVDSKYLNKSAGHHVYRLQLVNCNDKSQASVYFSYTYQDCDPEKPYVYMKRETTC